ncbi:MAG: leucine-rich repeat domain-containing protein [Promethearchaeia archaeon]
MSRIKKIIVTGEGGVGRSTLLKRYIDGTFNPNTPMTRGIAWSCKTVTHQGSPITLAFWDFAGQERWRFCLEPFVLGADGAILTFDLTRPQSLENIEGWVNICRRYNPELPILLVGTKLDLTQEISVNDEYALNFKENYNLFEYVKVSSRTGENIEILFNLLLEKLLKDEKTENEVKILDFLPNSQVPIENIDHQQYPEKITEFENRLDLILHLIQEENTRLASKYLNDLLQDPSILEFPDILNSATDVLNVLTQKLLHMEEQEENNHSSDYPISPSRDQERYPSLKKARQKDEDIFYVNDYLSLKLEKGKTNIYINGKKFNQCKFLLLDIPKEKISSLQSIDSIDEAAERLDNSLEFRTNSDYKISSKLEFWGHCSNLQAWADNNYDTRILHRNIAFPLLKKLTEAGDPLARRVFKEEIASRLEAGYRSVSLYLINEGYLDYLDKEEFESLDFSCIKTDNIEIWESLARLYKKHKIYDKAIKAYKKVLDIDPEYSGIWRDINSLFESPNLFTRIFQELPKGSKKSLLSMLILKNNKNPNKNIYEFLKPRLKKFNFEVVYYKNKIFEVKDNYLNLANKQIEDISVINGLQQVTHLEKLGFSFNKIKEIQHLNTLKSLKLLSFNFNRIKRIENLENLKNLRKLDFKFNFLKKIENLDKLSKLRYLNLSGNKLDNLNGIESLTNLKELILLFNNLKNVEGIESLKRLEKLDLRDNKIISIEGVEKLKNLKELHLSHNPITKLPDLSHLTKLELLDLRNTGLEELPEYVRNLPSLETIYF